MPTEPAPARIDKLIQLVATSSESWEDAATTAIAEAAKSIRDLDRASVVQKDITLVNREPVYRIKLQVSFRLDRNRIDTGGIPFQVHRYLVIANETLASDGLEQLIAEKKARFPSEFHVVVPARAPSMMHADPISGLIGPAVHKMHREARDAAEDQAQERLDSFQQSYSALGDDLTGEVMLGDPVAVARAVMSRASFDEIIISTLPVGLSRWLKLDLPSRIERAFSLPVITLIQDE